MPTPSHGTTFNAMAGGDVLATYSLEAGGVHPTTGKISPGEIWMAASDGTLPAPITQAYPLATDMRKVAGVAISLGQKASTASLPVVIASDQSTVSVSVASLPALTAGSAVIGHVVVDTAPSTAVTNAGTFATQATQAGTWNVGTVTTVTTVAAVTAITNALPAGTNALGTVAITAATSGGYSSSKVVAAATTNATNIKASAGQVAGWTFVNNNTSSFRYVKFYDSASAPTAGSGTPVWVVGLPPGGGSNLILPTGIVCTSGIGYTIVAGAADSDATAIAISEVVGGIFYK